MEKIKNFFYALRRNFTVISKEYNIGGTNYYILFDYWFKGLFYLYREDNLIIVANNISYLTDEKELEVVKTHSNKTIVDRYSLEGIFLATVCTVDTYKKYDIVHFVQNNEGICEKLIYYDKNHEDAFIVEIHKQNNKYFCLYNQKAPLYTDAEKIAFVANKRFSPLIMVEKHNKREFYNLYGEQVT